MSCALGLIATSAVSPAQTSTLPGQTDPIGNHLMQFRSDQLFSITDNFQNTILNTFSLKYIDNPFGVSLGDTDHTVTQPWAGIRQFHAASGRIVQPDHDDVVLVNADGANIDVQIVGQPAASITLPNILPRYIRTFPDGSSQTTVDFLAVAEGDLDRAIDSSGNYHDEVVVAYITQQNEYQLIVLDFSNNVADPTTGNVTVQPPTVVQFEALDGLRFKPSEMAGTLVGESHILPYENLLSVSAGDYDGDGSAEIAISAFGSPTTLIVQTLRYRPELTSILEIGSHTLTVPDIITPGNPETPPGTLGANLTTTSGDYEGRGADDLAMGYLSFVALPYHNEVYIFPNFDIHVLTAPVSAEQVTATLKPGNPTILTLAGSLAARIPSQLLINGAANSWNSLNGTWSTTLTSVSATEVAISIPVDTSSIAPGPNQTITVTVSTALGPVTVTPPLQIPLNNFLASVPDDYPKLQLVSGLFKFDPTAGWDFSRRQLAAVWNEPQNCSNPSCVSSAYKIAVSEYSVSSNNQGGLQFNKEAFTEVAAPAGTQAAQRVAVAAGAFRGNTILAANGTPNRPPIWSLAVNAWFDNSEDYVYTLEPNGAGFDVSSQSFPTNGVDAQERLAVVNYDPDGSSMYLGAPIRLTVSKIYTPTTILEEPPKQLAWVKGNIVNLNRNDGFNVQLQASSTEQASTTSQQQGSSAFSMMNSISAGASLKTTIFPGISNQFSVQDTAKFGFDQSHTTSSYYSHDGSVSYASGAQTDHDDFLQAQTQDLTVWRYRVYNGKGNAPSGYTFYDLTYPSSPYTASGSGLNTDWYNPIHENGNVLSYPPPPSNGLPDDVGPPYTVDGQVPGALTTGVLYSNQAFCFGGTSGPQNITITGVSKSGNSIGTSKTISWDNDTQVADKVNVVGNKVNASYDADFGGKQSLSTSTGSDNTTTGSTSVTFNVDSGDGGYAYNIFPVFYNSNAGVLKFTQYVSIADTSGDCTSGTKWWTDTYGGAPDPSLNLPFRFSFQSYNKSTDTTSWSLRTDLQREQLRGFFLTSATANAVESTPDNPVFTPLASNPAEGSTIRMAVRVYNFSLNQPATGVQAHFSVVPYDSATDNELACGKPAATETGRYCAPAVRTALGTATLPTIPSWGLGNNWAMGEYVWNIPEGFIAAQTSPEFRVYVNLTYPGAELNPPQLACNHALTQDSPCPSEIAVSSSDANWDPAAPGQNNEGFSYITLQTDAVQSVPPGGGPARHNIKSSRDSLAAIGLGGHLHSRLVFTYQGRPLRIRVKAVSEQGDIQDQQKVLVFDGRGSGQEMIAAKALKGVKAEGTSAWLEWTPTTRGLHRLTAEILEPQDDLNKGDNEATLSVVVIPAPGDVNGDGSVDGLDTAIVSDNLGQSTAGSTCGSACDLNGDGRIGPRDLDLVIAHCDKPYCAVSNPLPAKTE